MLLQCKYRTSFERKNFTRQNRDPIDLRTDTPNQREDNTFVSTYPVKSEPIALDVSDIGQTKMQALASGNDNPVYVVGNPIIK